jgi:serine/threonine protein kinase
VIQIVDLLPPPPGVRDFEDIYIVQDLMETDLDRVINSRQGLSIDHVRFFVYQLLRGLKYLHSANVLHRDLKPSNLLVNANCDLKICDFGLARVVEEELSGNLTEYVVTRWYRAPEILLATTDYTTAIDVWSVGCIFAELLAREPVFPGQDSVSQLKLIFERLGKPENSELDFIPSERTRRFVNSLKNSHASSMAELFPKYRAETDALDLLAKLLIFHPAKRITVNQALAHPFMATLHNEETETVADFTYSFPFDNEDLSSERVQELIWAELREMHPDMPTTCRVTSAAAAQAAESKMQEYTEADDRSTGKRSRSPTK